VISRRADLSNGIRPLLEEAAFPMSSFSVSVVHWTSIFLEDDTTDRNLRQQAVFQPQMKTPPLLSKHLRSLQTDHSEYSGEFLSEAIGGEWK
jgi:hypothetical protein